MCPTTTCAWPTRPTPIPTCSRSAPVCTTTPASAPSVWTAAPLSATTSTPMALSGGTSTECDRPAAHAGQRHTKWFRSQAPGPVRAPLTGLGDRRRSRAVSVIAPSTRRATNASARKVAKNRRLGEGLGPHFLSVSWRRPGQPPLTKAIRPGRVLSPAPRPAHREVPGEALGTVAPCFGQGRRPAPHLHRPHPSESCPALGFGRFLRHDPQRAIAVGGVDGDFAATGVCLG